MTKRQKRPNIGRNYLKRFASLFFVWKICQKVAKISLKGKGQKEMCFTEEIAYGLKLSKNHIGQRILAQIFLKTVCSTLLNISQCMFSFFAFSIYFAICVISDFRVK